MVVLVNGSILEHYGNETTRIKRIEAELRSCRASVAECDDRITDRMQWYFQEINRTLTSLVNLLRQRKTPVHTASLLSRFVELGELDAACEDVCHNLQLAKKSFELFGGLKLSQLASLLNTSFTKSKLANHEAFVQHCLKQVRVAACHVLSEMFRRFAIEAQYGEASEKWTWVLNSCLDENFPVADGKSPWSSLKIQMQLRMALAFSEFARGASIENDFDCEWVSTVWIEPLQKALFKSQNLDWPHFQEAILTVARIVAQQVGFSSLLVFKKTPMNSSDVLLRLKKCFLYEAHVLTRDFLAAEISTVMTNQWKAIKEDPAAQQKIAHYKSVHLDSLNAQLLRSLDEWQKLVEATQQILSPISLVEEDLFDSADFSILSSTNASLFDLCLEADRQAITRVFQSKEIRNEACRIFPMRGLLCLGAVLQTREIMGEACERFALIKGEANRNLYTREILDKLIVTRALEYIKSVWNARDNPFEEADVAASTLNSLELLELELQEPDLAQTSKVKFVTDIVLQL
eukprot:Gregarina_sp_Poly_1__3174@NODE_18_length_21885_cov_39_980383_g16_i0_p4_GENE_NODE_18_length_21885_cov_39_980383_g16_i0NODE_18_length_21885_cov_39_980383_g16_i0_p4_ORF_typecomplete_len519_score80_39AcylCoA_dh_2/PF08028_11/1_7e03AcylCoA_dh_2/PF08028_11/0_52Slx4/PF09494_10/2_2e03Slx4/PF09494_10/0_72_NODE_18_length_21885_cov_39_980383_g16_i01411697